MISKTSKLLVFSLVLFNIFLIQTLNASCLEVTDVSGGEDHTLALTQNKTVFGCGVNIVGQLGVGNQDQQTILEQTRGGEMGTKFLENIIKIDSGWTHSLALEDPCGFVWSWGSDSVGQLDDGSDIIVL